MRYIDSWLTGLGLEYIIPKLKANGITTPKKLALLTLRDMYEVVGVEDAEDRKKLYFLIQRLHTILNNKSEPAHDPDDDGKKSPVFNVTENSPDNMKGPSGFFADSMKSNGTERSSEEDLRVLRKNRRKSVASGAEQTEPPKEDKKESFRGPVPIPQSNATPTNRRSTIGSSKTSAPLSSLSSRSRTVDNLVEDDDVLEEPAPKSRVVKDIRGPTGSKQAPTRAQSEILSPPKSKARTRPSPPPPPPTSNAGIAANTRSRAKQTSKQQQSPPQHARVAPELDLMPPSPEESEIEPDELDQDGTDSNDFAEFRHEAEEYEDEEDEEEEEEEESASSRRGQQQQHSPQYDDDDYDDEDEEIASGSDHQINDPDMPIRVVVRKRPISRTEKSRGDYDVLEIRRAGKVFVHEPKVKVDLTKVIETQNFIFDDAFTDLETNENIYARTIKHLVSFVFEGGKASCFAYGQTGSGKTFSMMGSRPDAPAEAKVNAGLYVLAARDLFFLRKQPQYKHLRVLVSCFEIYGGKLFDLLNDRGIVKCLEDAKQQVQLPGLTEHPVDSVEELLELMAQAHRQRSTGSTGANAESSRSHQVMQLVLQAPETKKKSHRQSYMAGYLGESNIKTGNNVGKLSFIDLAGSERGADTTHSSKQTRMEGAEINTSLLALKEVIRSLERKHGHTPFRGSKLTQVLKDSFVGEKTRTCMVACVSPSHSNCEHTLNTLRYADRVKEHQQTSTGTNPAGNGAHTSSSSNHYNSLAYDAPNSRPTTGGRKSNDGNTSDVSDKPGKLNRQASAPISRSKDKENRSQRNDGRTEPPRSRPKLPRTLSEMSGGGSQDYADTGERRKGPGSKLTRRHSHASMVDDAEEEVQQQSKQKGMSPIAESNSPASGSPNKFSFADQGKNSRQSVGLNNGRSKSAGRSGSARPRSYSTSGVGGPRHTPGGRIGDAHGSQYMSEDTDDSEFQQGPKGKPRPQSAMVRRGSSQQAPSSTGNSLWGEEELSDPGNGLSRLDSISADDQDVLQLRGAAGGRGEAEGKKRVSSKRQVGKRGAGDDSSVEDVSVSKSDGLGGTELIQKTVNLLSSHKMSIAEMVEVMKVEMEIVQQMENVEDRDSRRYVKKLENILNMKSSAISKLKTELNSFRKYRNDGSKKVKLTLQGRKV